VQGVLEGALEQITNQKVSVIGAGRTDAGVHARGQVIAFDVEWRYGLDVLERALNATLPEDVAVRDLAPVGGDFHPRYSARSRTYEYTIYNRPLRSPLARRTAWHVPMPLDVAAMAQATQAIVGEHDFAAFGRPPKGENTIRCVMRAGWRVDGPLVLFEIEANAFLYRMVRHLVSALKKVGEGAWTVEDFAEVLRSRDRARVKGTAPAHGLCLIEVSY
jgi:tRNA pseudouridine38-40 synthase